MKNDDPRGIPFAPTEPDCRPAAARPAPGLVLAGKYQLMDLVGEGGMGTVWRAQRLGWGKSVVAVKMMTVPDPRSPLALERFAREAQLTAELRSEHIVQVLDDGFDAATGLSYIVMELLEGESLAARRRRTRTLSPAEVLRLFEQLERALTATHGAGVIHRDLKPENIFLVGKDPLNFTAKVLDFGVARSIEPTVDGRPVTAEGRPVGTAWYMSPEQLRGRRDLDHRVDLWSLACIACECLTGRPPFETHDLRQLLRMVVGRHRPVPSASGSVPVGFDRWFAKATAANIERRFQSARELVDALRPICAPAAEPRASGDGEDAAPMAPTHTSSVAPLSRTTGALPGLLFRRPKWVVTLAAAAVGMAAGSAYFISTARRPPSPLTGITQTSSPSTAIAAAAPSGSQISVPVVPAGIPSTEAPSEPVAPAASAATSAAAGTAQPPPTDAAEPPIPNVSALPAPADASATDHAASAPAPETRLEASRARTASPRPSRAPRPRRARATEPSRSPPAQPTPAPSDEVVIRGRILDTTF